MLFVLTQTWPSALCQTRTLRGRSIARSGDAIINGVPPCGLPKISTWASCIVSPTRLASPLWSIWAKRVRLRLCIASWRRCNVSSTENGLGLVTMPSTEGGVPGFVGSFMFLTSLLCSTSCATWVISSCWYCTSSEVKLSKATKVHALSSSFHIGYRQLTPYPDSQVGVQTFRHLSHTCGQLL